MRHAPHDARPAPSGWGPEGAGRPRGLLRGAQVARQYQETAGSGNESARGGPTDDIPEQGGMRGAGRDEGAPCRSPSAAGCHSASPPRRRVGAGSGADWRPAGIFGPKGEMGADYGLRTPRQAGSRGAPDEAGGGIRGEAELQVRARAWARVAAAEGGST
jgi:hypothetical protein